MAASSHHRRRAAGILALGACIAFGPVLASGQTLTNVVVRVMAANLSSGASQLYESAGIRILKGLRPDIVAIQEFNHLSAPSSPAQIRSFVDAACGTDYSYHREPYTNSGDIPNGIISRHPILASGSWVDSDAGVNNRGFAWAHIDLPGTNDLFVVSVHLKAGASDSARRAAEAAELKALISTNFPANAWILVGGDLNIGDSSEAALATLKTFLSDSPIPTDAASGGDPDTNASRSERYDYLLPSFALTNCLTNMVIGTRSFPNGLVFDSAVYEPLSEVSPVIATDSHVSGMQHMAVIKDLRITYVVTNPATPPSITAQPRAQFVHQAAPATFSVTATGTEPLDYQWRFHGTNLAGATTSGFTRSNSQPEHVGPYSVLVSSAAGHVTSSNAALQLIVPAPALVATPDLLRWQGLSNLGYTVESRTNLATGSWQAVGRTSSPTHSLSFPRPDTNAPQIFFRVVHP